MPRKPILLKVEEFQPRRGKRQAKRPTALGAYIFAGGFTVGVKQAGFEVLACLEGDGGYGVSTARKNFPNLDIRHGPANWRVEDFKDRDIDLIYGNPPCAAWSVNNPNSHTPGAWRDDPRVDCTKQHFGLLKALKPKVWVWESVTQAPEKGRELVDALIAEAKAEGYTATEIYHDSKWLGAPQTRKRWFLVLHRVGVTFRAPNWAPPTSGAEALSEVRPIGPPAYDSVSNGAVFNPHLKNIPPGARLRDYWQKVICPPEKQVIKENGHVKGRPGFGHVRLSTQGPASATVGYSMVHPTEHRFLSVNEVAALAGFPPGFEFVGGPSGALQLDLIARGVCPPVGKWLASEIAASLDAERPLDKIDVTVVDYRNPPDAQGELKMPKPAKKPVAARAAAKDPYFSTETALREPAPSSQGTRGKALPQHVDPNREFDKTSLRVGGSQERTVHRDYAAHFFRWGFAGRFVDGATEILDVGCGPDLAFIAVLNHPRSNVPKRYVGVDLNKRPRFVPSRQWAESHWEFNFLKRYAELGKFDLVTNFEVIEHMRKPEGEKLLAGMAACLKPAGQLLLSTPVFNGKAAANHLHEWTIPELQVSIEKAGLKVVKRFGTFASHNDIKKAAKGPELEIAKKLSEYYSGEVLACFLAPLYPDASRNNVWLLQLKSGRKK